MAINKQMTYIRNLAVPIVIGLIIWFFPIVPNGLPLKGLHMLAIFVATILAIILKPLPMSAVAIVGLTVSMLTGVVASKETFKGFSSSSVWLVVLAFFISKAIIKSGLGHRLAYVFISYFGKKTLGLIYALLGVDLIIGTATPSSTARAGGIMAPIIRSVSESYDSYPDDPSRKKIGSYLMNCIYHGDSTVAILFLTAGATKPLAQNFAAEYGVHITWMNWFLGAIVPGLIALILIPLCFMKLDPPEIKETPNAPEWARTKLKELGRMKLAEKNTTWIFCLALLLWVTGSMHSISAEGTALIAVALLLITKVLEFSDITSEKGAWNTLIWFAILVMMAGQLNTLGFVPWFSQTIANMVSGYTWIAVFLILCLVFFYSHYFFASLIAHVTAMYPAFLAVALAAGAPPLYAALMLAYITNICASTTHYASGPASIIYGSGYITQQEWWKYCFIMGVLYLVIWLGIGSLWMRLIGFL